MAGIYIHIPFCRQACHYCDFHFSTNLGPREQMVEMICRELELRRDYLEDKRLSTVYFGGGTPSLLSDMEIGRIMKQLHRYFVMEENAEITLEANPDDLKEDTLRMLLRSGVNRLSIGVQSFHNPHLQSMNRAHTAVEAEESVKRAQDAGFDNISIDLIYGIPAADHQIWETDLQKSLNLKVQHISSYCLTIEPGTVLGRRYDKGIYLPATEEFSAIQFEMLTDILGSGGFEHYEISNFALPGLYSRHNSAYWKGNHYLGIGPGAHSFNGVSRQYTIENNQKYLNALKEDQIPATLEILDAKTRANEYIMTSLRTIWGLNCDRLEADFGISFESVYPVVNKYQEGDYLLYENNTIKLSKKGMLIADKITADLFII